MLAQAMYMNLLRLISDKNNYEISEMSQPMKKKFQY